MIQVTLYRKEKILPDTYLFLVKLSANESISFSSGQYVYIKNPEYNKDESHPFSIVSSPLEKKHLEFCIKVHGNWTKALAKAKKGHLLEISKPIGNFTWDDSIQNAVFLLGGIGISPVMSILTTLQETGQKPRLTLLYGNRTPKNIAYKKELEVISRKLPLKIIHIFSHLPINSSWKGHRGFITKEIIEKEVRISKNLTWFVIGPPIFIGKMVTILENLHISKEKIKTEDISSFLYHSS